MASAGVAFAREEILLTESEVQRSFSKLVKGDLTTEILDKVEVLLDELRPESPLRHRLSVELDEIRERITQTKS